MVGLPMELLTFIGSGLMSAVMSMWSMSLKAKAQAHSELMDKVGAERARLQEARAYGKGSREIQWTKRVLAFMTVFAVIVLPKLAALFSIIPVTVGYTEFHPGFWFLVDAHDAIAWKTATGFVITPLDTHFCAAVAGFYFGSSVVRNA